MAACGDQVDPVQVVHAAWDGRTVPLDVLGVEVPAYEVVHLVVVPAVAPEGADACTDCVAMVRDFARVAP